tara:strand:- start:5939 stop:6835 length:897 start_codon:yes stop_codon:yes gene_type:complete
MTFNRARPLFLPSIASLALHLVLWSILSQSLADFMQSSDKPAVKQDRAIKVTTLSEEEIKKYRTIGVKNGAKDFSTPQKEQPKPAPQISKPIKSESLKLGQLGSIDTTHVAEPSRPLPKSEKNIIREQSNIQVMNDSSAPIEVKAVRSQDRFQALRNMGIAESDARKLSKTDFDVNFIPPEGVSEDELNSAEKMFYSFQKRTFESYVSSFLSTYHSMVRDTPRLRDPLMQNRHFLTARVIFDTEGNIMSIRIMRSSPNDDIHKLFESTLRNIRKLPNPPKDLLNKDQTFTIYYQLKVN